MVVFVGTNQDGIHGSTITKVGDLIVGLIAMMTDMVGMAGTTTEPLTVGDASPSHRVHGRSARSAR